MTSMCFSILKKWELVDCRVIHCCPLLVELQHGHVFHWSLEEEEEEEDDDDEQQQKEQGQEDEAPSYMS